MTRSIAKTRTTTETEILAAEAPLGVQLCPTHYSEDSTRYTLAKVEVVPGGGMYALADHIRWTYETGHTRTFGLNERVVVHLPA